MNEEKIGELFGLFTGVGEKIDVLTGIVNDQSQKISSMSVNLAVLKTVFENQSLVSGKHFELIDSRLHRDYTRLNDLEKARTKIQSESNGIEKWKSGKSKIAKIIVGTLSSLLALIIAINQVWGIIQKVETPPIPTTISSQINPGVSR